LLHTPEISKIKSEKMKSKKWWNDGRINCRSENCPGNEWALGRLPLKLGNKNAMDV
jgi:hypothetical protein